LRKKLAEWVGFFSFSENEVFRSGPYSGF